MDGRDRFEIEVNGKKIPAYRGQTIAEAILASGIRVLRTTQNNAPRGIYCAMGICYECRMIVNGVPNVRTCMTPATPGSRVTTQTDAKIRLEK